MNLARHLGLAAGAAALLLGFALLRPWESEQGPLALFLLLAVAGQLAGGWLLARLLRLPLAGGLALVGLSALGIAHGWAAIVTCLVFALAALGVGSLVVAPPASPQAAGRAREQAPSDAPWLATVIGSALIAGVAGWLLPLPLFSAPSVATVLLLLLLWRRRAILAQLIAARITLRDAAAESPFASTGLMLVLLASISSAWLPVMSADDLALHLQIGWSLSELGYYRMDVGSQVWSLTPWLSDVVYGLQHLVAGAETAPAQNALWLALTAFLIVGIGRCLGLAGALPWLAAMLYVSTPIVSSLGFNMQTEAASAAATAALALLVLRAPDTPDRRILLAAAALAGALLGMKIINAGFIAPLALLLLWRWRFAVNWRDMPAALLLGALIAGSSYTYAYGLTGNPVLPLFNDLFASPWYPSERQLDSRWQIGVTPMSIFWLSFASSDYYEGSLSGTAGFALVLLFAGTLGALADRRLAAVMLAAALAWLIPFSQVQYVRYTVPALVLLIPVLMAGLQTQRRWLAVAATLVVVIQLVYLPSGAWTLKSNAVPIQLKWGREVMMAQMAPERELAAIYRQRMRPTDRLLFTSSGYSSAAELTGHAYVSDWYDAAIWAELTGPNTPHVRWSRVLDLTGANLVALRRDVATDELRDVLQSRRAEQVAVVDSGQLYRLPEAEQAAKVIEVNPERIKLAFPHTADRAELIRATVDIECSAAFKPIAVHWWVHSDTGDPRWQKFFWAICDARGRSELQLELAVPADVNSTLMLEAKPVSDEHDQRLALLGHGQIRRPDLSRERDLGVRVRRPLCEAIGWPCEPEKVKLLSMEG